MSLLLATGAVEGGVLLETESSGSALPAQPQPVNGQLQLQGNFARMDADEQSTMLFDSVTQTMRILDHANRRYMTVDREAAEQLAEQLDPMIAEMKAQLEGLPPDQRAMVEEMMGGRLNLAGAPEEQPTLALEATGRKGDSAGFACEWWRASDEGTLVYELCVAAPGELPGGEDMLGLFRAMVQFNSDIMRTVNRSGLIRMPRLPFDSVADIEGMPLITRQYDGGAVVMESRIKGITETEFPATDFAVPEDYTAQSFDMKQ
jgi:hypothetical protein